MRKHLKSSIGHVCVSYQTIYKHVKMSVILPVNLQFENFHDIHQYIKPRHTMNLYVNKLIIIMPKIVKSTLIYMSHHTILVSWVLSKVNMYYQGYRHRQTDRQTRSSSAYWDVCHWPQPTISVSLKLCLEIYLIMSYLVSCKLVLSN